MRKTHTLAVLVVLAAAFSAACSPPKYAQTKSVFGDFTVSAPWGWSVMTDGEGDAFSQVSFIGAFDRDFFLGAPSLSVRWYKRYRPHRLRDGRLEMYADVDDFFNQILKQVYGEKDCILYGPGRRADGGRVIIARPEELTLKGSGLKAKYFIVLSPTPAPDSNRWGLEQNREGKSINMRMHGYALIPMEGGFYVLCYPATRRGYDKYEDRFRALIGTFRPLTAGPNGPKVRLAVPAS
ncbi:MAG TPA: hypothetical protein DCZ01_01695 [Elusimicrobia bacterium]|nr:MAG: hypothetical protein A2X37_07345 [Elusimicrobia bacterium GWA2_66_18]OGR76688.1 MAG: hypothetical protein A2X40_02010 [Elusimicrobia bacterium GWC2_65_9]HAZ07243.1 hypothetical protein [Elusimicrobiota bacterium]